MRTLRRLGPDVWLLCASVIAAAAVGRLFQGGLGGRASGPLLVAAAVGSAVPALLALKRVPLPVRAVVGTIAVILTSLWTAIGAGTAYGLPTARTWHVAQSDLRRRGHCSYNWPSRSAPPRASSFSRQWPVVSSRCWHRSSCTPATYEVACTQRSHSSARWVFSRLHAAKARRGRWRSPSSSSPPPVH